MISATAWALSALRAMPGPSPCFMLLVMQATRKARLAAPQRLDHLRPNVAAQRLQDAPAVEFVALLACLFLEQFDEAFEGNLAAFHFCPRIGVAIARIEAADEIFGKSDLGLIPIEGLERAARGSRRRNPTTLREGFLHG